MWDWQTGSRTRPTSRQWPRSCLRPSLRSALMLCCLLPGLMYTPTTPSDGSRWAGMRAGRRDKAYNAVRRPAICLSECVYPVRIIHFLWKRDGGRSGWGTAGSLLMLSLSSKTLVALFQGWRMCPFHHHWRRPLCLNPPRPSRRSLTRALPGESCLCSTPAWGAAYPLQVSGTWGQKGSTKHTSGVLTRYSNITSVREYTIHLPCPPCFKTHTHTLRLRRRRL